MRGATPRPLFRSDRSGKVHAPPYHRSSTSPRGPLATTAPLDPRAESDRRNLLAYVWPEQLERMARLRAALDLARADELTVERADSRAMA
jgi:hypothetical protein